MCWEVMNGLPGLQGNMLVVLSELHFSVFCKDAETTPNAC